MDNFNPIKELDDLVNGCIIIATFKKLTEDYGKEYATQVFDYCKEFIYKGRNKGKKESILEGFDDDHPLLSLVDNMLNTSIKTKEEQLLK